MLKFVPDHLPAGAPLVVVLHGCSQNAASYDLGSGWSTLAQRCGFALLYPQQRSANNPNTCFNWFEADDTRRGSGEAASIASATAAMVAAHGLDPSRVFVTGLSAGGAMAAVLLAAYPDVFAGGAVIAGLPAGSAQGVSEALRAMLSPGAESGDTLGRRVRGASTFTGPWPIVSVWHGEDDRTVNLRNGAAVAAQWRDIHAADTPASEHHHPRLTTTTWHDAAGVAVVELNQISGMGHGTAIAAGSDGSVAAPYMLDVGIPSSAHIAAFWGLADRPVAVRRRPASASAPTSAKAAPVARESEISRLISDTLRSVGLMK